MPLLILELIILCLIFWGICFLGSGSDEKNIKSYASYPDEIQKIVKENPELRPKINSSSPVVSFASNILVFGIVLLIFGLFFKKSDFKTNFINLLISGQSLNAFDFLVIDMLWWRNSKRIRFEGTKNRAELYSNPKKHFISFLKGIALFLVIALIDGLILSIIN